MSKRSVAGILLAGTVGLNSMTQAVAQQVCRPVLAFNDVQFSQMQPPTMERKWTAVVSVDASRCAAASGPFKIGFSRLKETAPEIDFREEFTWRSRSVWVAVDFWADEAVAGYWLDTIPACHCQD